MSPESEASRKHTALFQAHKQAGARFVDYAGWEMPIQYEGTLAEHRAVRAYVGLFDVSHMGRFQIQGSDAVPFIARLVTNDVQSIEVGQAQYNVMCYEDGGIIDDLLVYRLPDRILAVVNASNKDKDLKWMQEHTEGLDVQIDDLTEQTALLAVQGPKAQQLLSRLTSTDLDQTPYYRFTQAEVAGSLSFLSRTGYTGEDGFEIWLPVKQANKTWQTILAFGQDLGVKPCGLGARDTLRLEMGYCLYGHEIDQTTNPLEAGLGWIVKLDKPDFIGKQALISKREQGLNRRLVGIKLEQKHTPVPRQTYPIFQNGEQIGSLASGTISPSLGIGIGTGYVPVEYAKVGTGLLIPMREKLYEAKVTRMPFYKNGSIRRQ
jgi:aminomethyltransferase